MLFSAEKQQQKERTMHDILVHLDDSPGSPERLQIAIDLCKQMKAQLKALYVSPLPHIPSYIRMQLPRHVIAEHAKETQTKAKAAKAQFEETLKLTDIEHHWCHETGELHGLLIKYARYSDLVVLGQPHPDGEDTPGYADVLHRALLNMGRPVLIVPQFGIFKTIGKHILIAWDESKSACRAMNDSLEFLHMAEKVEALSLYNKKADKEKNTASKLGDYLAQRNIKCEASDLLTFSTNFAEFILNHANERQFDLLIMGGFGRHRLKELVLGGVTKYILQHMQLPVFMSH
jgi:nucleotide-binding universal stress UspA family protein